MNRYTVFIVCLFLLLTTYKSHAQDNQKLMCHVKKATFKVKQENGNWSNWRQYNTNDKTDVNVIVDFRKMSLYWVSRSKTGNKPAEPAIRSYKITGLSHDTGYRELGFYAIKIKCLDEKGITSLYEIISLGINNCYSLVLISNDDKIVTKHELEIL